MQLKSQRKTVFVAGALLAAASLAMAGCSKKEEPVAETPPPVEAPVTPPADAMATTPPAAETPAPAETPPAAPAETPPPK
jgi:hypothetical protein